VCDYIACELETTKHLIEAARCLDSLSCYDQKRSECSGSLNFSGPVIREIQNSANENSYSILILKRNYPINRVRVWVYPIYPNLQRTTNTLILVVIYT
jgi:hypothetical protein